MPGSEPEMGCIWDMPWLCVCKYVDNMYLIYVHISEDSTCNNTTKNSSTVIRICQVYIAVYI